MRCDRCSGLMVIEDCIDFKGSVNGFWIKMFRCVMCGNLVDSLIARHRTLGIPADVIPIGKKAIRRAPRTPVARLTA